MKKIKLILLLNSFLLIPVLSQNFSYTPGSLLLRKGIEYVEWGQSVNNDFSTTYNGCTPAYNQYCPPGNGACGKTVAGCGAVVMGQIMWKWEWPHASSYRTYNWRSMPAELLKDDLEAGDAIANLLRDCGRAVNMNYMDINILGVELTGSWCTMGNLVDGLKAFEYKSVKSHSKSDWGYGSAWEDLIRSEIRAGRSAIYYGDNGLLSEDKHYFIIDGYSATNQSEFHINFGWRGKHDDFRRLNNISNSNGTFNSNQKIITGISPTLPNSTNLNLYDVSYTSVSNTRTESARQNIALPASGKTLSVENGGNLTLTAGNSITLKPGFRAKTGSNFTAKIEPVLTIDKEIRVANWKDYLYIKFDNLCIDVENADSWEFQVFDANGYSFFQSAGNITNGKACVWDGTNAVCGRAYRSILRFKNSYGRAIEKEYPIHILCGARPCVEGEDITITPLNSSANVNGNILLALTPNGDGVNDEVCFSVIGGDRWEAEVFNGNQSPIYRSGNVVNNVACVWDGYGFPCGNEYWAIVYFKSVSGCVVEKLYVVRKYCVGVRSSEITDSNNFLDSTEFEEAVFESPNGKDSFLILKEVDDILAKEKIKSLRSEVVVDLQGETSAEEQQVFLSPNPSKGKIVVNSAKQNVKDISVYNSAGILCLQTKEVEQQQIEVDLSAFPDGIYTFNIKLESNIVTQKVILKK